MIPELFVFIQRKRSRDNFARKRKIHAVTRLVCSLGEGEPRAKKIAAAALKYACAYTEPGTR